MVQVLFVIAGLMSQALAVDPVPKTPSQEKAEQIQQSGGALKVEKKPAPLDLYRSEHPDPAMNVIEGAAEMHQQSIPVPEPRHQWGPSLQIGFPHPLNAGLHFVHASKMWSAEISAGSFEVQNIEDTDINFENQELNLRWHPFATSFFVGYGYGRQNVKVKGEDFVAGQTVRATVDFESDYHLPQVGWMTGMEDGGFFWSFELGWQMPTNAKTRIRTNVDLSGNPAYDEFIQDVRDTTEKAGEDAVPNIALIKFGWLF